MYESVNPYNQEKLASFPTLTNERLEQSLQTAHEVAATWSRIPLAERAKRMLHLAQLIEEHTEQLAVLASLEMGKTLKEARLEVLKCKTACIHYASQSDEYLKTKVVQHDDGRSVFHLYEPMGTVLGVFPWNFPYWQIIRSSVPIIMAGNTMLVKPAPNTPQCAIALQKLFDEAGLGNGVITTVFLSNEQVTTCIADDRIHACTLTGSEQAGSAVASQAAKFIKKAVLELGGSDPFIVLSDADLGHVVSNAIGARFQNNGQSCIASKRFIIHKSLYNQFLEGIKQKLEKLNLGNQLEELTDIGPLARLDLKQKLEKQVRDTVSLGGQVAYQHPFKHHQTCFYPPTILKDIPENAPAFTEELFGPVLSVYSFVNEEDAISLANATSFGLGATIWTKDRQKAISLAGEIQCGQVFINAVTRSHTAYPFGGAKRSGFGREMGMEGMREFCNLKTVWI